MHVGVHTSKFKNRRRRHRTEHEHEHEPNIPTRRTPTRTRQTDDRQFPDSAMAGSRHQPEFPELGRAWQRQCIHHSNSCHVAEAGITLTAAKWLTSEAKSKCKLCEQQIAEQIARCIERPRGQERAPICMSLCKLHTCHIGQCLLETRDVITIDNVLRQCIINIH